MGDLTIPAHVYNWCPRHPKVAIVVVDFGADGYKVKLREPTECALCMELEAEPIVTGWLKPGLTHAELLKLAETRKPPQAWYEETE